ncbi:hypothetical protein ALQ08_00993 [Pseudomonas syringae pv. delphinii]|uniref:Uncharacterized protein n=1 Tax=Pseudomonas syringae pv. delphinii TaxID=192088 RepID=A0A0P9Q5A0_9PSED|nr:hypothetical protein [Pseudomonas syringae group genomosp. 3]KPX26013.1 Uncharacterized protein ALO72_03185 [Pseudomonas syringae pv. delphinii]RMP18272.1 hypothetical protein ALQ28_03884 [Pseudomonas syringae pv. delphinii]RMQ27792.1 hypothetical protein ALQ08_00993 [Pseudomonas syringae pv. delphinii]
MSASSKEADRMHHAGLALFALTRVLRENIDYIDAPGGGPLSVRDQHGLLLAAEHIAEEIYTHLEHQALDLQDNSEAEAGQ